jgi:hypothetical protein
MIKQQTFHTLETILQQNYFQYDNKFYKPNKGVAMGSPVSGLVVEIFLQYFEQIIIKHSLEHKSLIFYTRYVDILIIYDQTRINCNQILHQANSIYRNLLFNVTQKNNATISFLDILIHRINTGVETEIDRKPTSTDTVICITSNHPYEHRLAAFRFILTRMHKLPLTPQYKQKNGLINLFTLLGISNINNDWIFYRFYKQTRRIT